jgi:hypothetical protein
MPCLRVCLLVYVRAGYRAAMPFTTRKGFLDLAPDNGLLAILAEGDFTSFMNERRFSFCAAIFPILQ